VGSAAAVASDSRWVTINNAKLAVQWPTYDSGSNNTSVSVPGLYPFLDGYGAYAGQCSANKPATVQNVTTNPNSTSTPAIWTPSINLRVTTNTSTSSPTYYNGATIVIKSADSGCTNTFATQTSSSVTYGSTTYTGTLPDPGFPYGRYTICAQRTVNGVTRRAFADVYPYTTTATVNETVINNTQAGNSPTFNTAGSIRIYLSATNTPATGQAGSCPT
jgi:hypothetical protein